MIIAIDESLDKLNNDLKTKGYQTINVNCCSSPINAYIYKNRFFDAINTGLLNSNDNILIINGSGRSVNEIQSILHSKCYSPLF